MAKQNLLIEKAVWFWPDNFSAKCWKPRENLSRDGRDPLVHLVRMKTRRWLTRIVQC